MKVKCISPRLNHVVFGHDGNGRRTPKRVRPGDTFNVRAIPEAWRGLVVAVDGDEQVAVTNPAEDNDLPAMREEYKSLAGKPAHHSWGVETLEEKIAELKSEE